MRCTDLGSTPSHFDVRFLSCDLKAGLILSFMAIAFGLAIASISKFPLMAGIVSAVVGGLIGSVFGRSPTSIYGAAAALAPILAGAVVTLGHGNEAVGYPLTLAVIFTVGVLMTVVGQLRLARFFASFFSHAVISGVLASIAIILLLSRLPMFLGTEFETPSGVLRVWEFPTRIDDADTNVFTITIATLVFLITLTALKRRMAFFTRYPPQLFAIPFVLFLSVVLSLPEEHRITLPSFSEAGLAAPNFVGLLADPSIWWSFVAAVIVLCIVDTAETVATVLGIGQQDPHKRIPDVDKTVRSMGFANILGSVFGGMSNIPGGAKSTMATQIGATTAWAGIFCAVFVVIEVAFGKWLINLLPQSGLAMIIVFTVLRLASPAVFRHFRHVGIDQFVVFLTTFAVGVLYNDILHGMIAGVLLQLLIVLLLSMYAARASLNGTTFLETLWVVWNLWTRPLVDVTARGEECEIRFRGVWVFYKTLDQVFARIPPHTKLVRIHIGAEVLLMDAPTMERIHEYAERHGVDVVVDGVLRRLSSHEHATHILRTAD